MGPLSRPRRGPLWSATVPTVNVVGVIPGYFPHERSLDYGVLLRGTIPLSTLGPIWRRLPLRWISRATLPLADML